MKKDRFLWSAHRITERQKAGKARSIKGKQLKNSRSTVSKQLVALRSSASDNSNRISKRTIFPENIKFSGIFIYFNNSVKTPQRCTRFSRELIGEGKYCKFFWKK